jgi:pyrimidine-nucleoside phosphorylase
MKMTDLIQLKKEKKTLSKDMINYMIKNYTSGKIPDYQMSSMAMAILLNGMTDEETSNLAIAMKDSGDIIDLTDIDGIKVDKHSTGGVGDKTSLIIGPIIAHYNLKFAKMSGRGLGHTGGTIDKLESIPGFKVELSKSDFINQVKKINIAIIGQSKNIAPADKKLYALRDVSATIDSMPLIASSIMSKKLASGSDVIVLDVKVGQGAFMKNIKKAEELANLMVKIGYRANKKVSAVLTNMNQPLGNYVGNALEIFEVINTLKGNGPEDLNEVVKEIVVQILINSNVFKNKKIASIDVDNVLKSGEAYKYFEKMVHSQGGNVASLKDFHKQFAINKKEIYSDYEGWINEINALKIGNAAMILGAGRQIKSDKIDHSVGIQLNVKVGMKIKKGNLLATIYHNNKGLKESDKLLRESIVINESPSKKQKMIYKVIKK